jgi:hypothetical protein
MRRHRLDLISLFFGLTFVAIGGVFISGQVDVTDIDWEVTWPLPLIAGGLMMLAGALRAMTRSKPETAGDEVDHTAGSASDEFVDAQETDVIEVEETGKGAAPDDFPSEETPEEAPADDEPPWSAGEKRPPRP